MSSLKKLYGYPLIVNLLGRKEGESLLSSAFINHMNDSEHSKDTSIVSFDYHHHCKGDLVSIYTNLGHLTVPLRGRKIRRVR